jgi:hypothetical protein
MGKVEDIGVIGQRREETPREKPLKNNAKCKNEQGQKKALLEGRLIMCPQTKE